MVSVMITSITMIMETVAPMPNCGAPKWNGVEMEPLRLPDLAEVGQAERRRDRVPRTSPARMAMRLKKPGRNR